MGWLAAGVFFVSLAFGTTTFWLWRKLRRLEARAVQKYAPVVRAEGDVFNSVELSLEAMLEELELKQREIIQRIERREREILTSLERFAARLPQSDPNLPVEPLQLEEATPPVTEAQRVAPLVQERLSSKQPTPAANRLQGADKIAAVRRLAGEGLDAVAIAKQLGLGKGEVTLILDLERTV